MTTPATITISKPIDEVISYVIDANNWAEWGKNYYLSSAQKVDTNTIEATYDLPEGTKTVRWQVSRAPSGKNQLVIFTNEDAPMQTAEYIFASKALGAFTDVARNEANLDNKDDISSGLLLALKEALEKGA